MTTRPRRAGVRPLWSAALVLVAVLTGAPSVVARARGIVVENCSGCHGGGAVDPPDLTLTAEPAAFNPGDSVTLTLVIRSPSIHVGGAFITTGGVGTLQAVSGEGLAINAQGLTHTSPKAASNGAVSFRFAWRAPATPGGVDFGVAALAGNGNNASSGDAPFARDFQWVYGCAPRTFYLDLDRDGYGSSDLATRLGCVDAQPPSGYATMAGDCDENSEKAYPGATEVCNLKDDDCDGQIDDGAPPVMMWPDSDGDGYYGSQLGNSKLGCGNVAGYAASGGDCDDGDPAVNPGAKETCNRRDDNCDGTVDELVRPQCGVGWCARYSPSCEPAECRPGPPAAEKCNHFDDDCDGEDDNAACPAGMSCLGEVCVANDTSVDPERDPTRAPSDAGSASVMSPGGAARAQSPPSDCAIRSAGRRGGEGWVVLALCGGLGLRRRRRLGSASA